MSELNRLAFLMCSAALLLSSCTTPDAGGAVTARVVYPAPAVITDGTSRDPGSEVTVGTLTDPCALALNDPWWTDHGGRVEFHRRCG